MLVLLETTQKKRMPSQPLKSAINQHSQEEQEKENRDRNLIIHRVPESHKKDLAARKTDDAVLFQGLCGEVLELDDVEVVKTVRLCRKQEGKHRPLKIILKDRVGKRRIMASLYKLKEAAEPFSNLSVCNDMTLDERKTRT